MSDEAATQKSEATKERALLEQQIQFQQTRIDELSKQCDGSFALLDEKTRKYHRQS